MSATTTALRPRRSSSSRALLVTWLAMLIAAAPLAAVMLTPQLMRSRVEALPGLATLGISLFLLLGAAGVVLGPLVSAAVAPATGWTTRTVATSVRQLRRRDPWAWRRRLAECLLIFVASQLVGGGIAWWIPHFWRDTTAAGGADDGRWVFSYLNYAVQAVTMYMIVCFGYAWYATRLRGLAAGAPRDDHDRSGSLRRRGTRPRTHPSAGSA